MIARHTGQFKRGYKRESKGRYKKTVCEDLQALVELPAADLGNKGQTAILSHSFEALDTLSGNCGLSPISIFSIIYVQYIRKYCQVW